MRALMLAGALALAALCGAPGAALAAAPNYIAQTVGVCDPNYPPNCAGGAASTQVAVTITTHGTFQSALAASLSRRGCLILNTTTADTVYVFFGATGSATTGNSIPLAPGQSVNCFAGNIILTDNVAVTVSATDGAAVVVISQ